jgi:hypothetical protein
MSSLDMKTAGDRVRGAAARAFTPLESLQQGFAASEIGFNDRFAPQKS